MKYRLVTTKRFDREFKKLDGYTRQMIKSWIDNNLLNIENPRAIGKILVGNYKGHWRYRIGNYRLICQINDDELLLLALSVGHRKNIYK